MIALMEERRRRRSREQYAALRYQLEHTRERGSIEALVLADRDGLVVASSGDAGVCGELGAVAPLLSRAPYRVTMPPLLKGAEVTVRRVSLYGQDLFLACAGGSTARDALLTTSLHGVRRILASN